MRSNDEKAVGAECLPNKLLHPKRIEVKEGEEKQEADHSKQKEPLLLLVNLVFKDVGTIISKNW